MEFKLTQNYVKKAIEKLDNENPKIESALNDLRFAIQNNRFKFWGVRIYPEKENINSFLLNPIYLDKEVAEKDALALRKKYHKVEVEAVYTTRYCAFS